MSLATTWNKLYPELDVVLKQLVDTAQEMIEHDNPDDDETLIYKKLQEYLNQYLDEKLTDAIERKKIAKAAEETVAEAKESDVVKTD